MNRIACFGGVYSNYLALDVAIQDARQRGVDEIICLGDFGAFGPHPNRSLDLLREHNITCIQGNYDHSIGNDLDDCQCGYTDPRDNYFAQISYDYTLSGTSLEHRRWMRELPQLLRWKLGSLSLLICHGSPRQTNEFLWESTTPTHFLDKLARDYQTDVILCTHTGIRWQRELTGGRQAVNVGVLGRPENDGQTNVWYTILSYSPDVGLQVEFVPVEYDFRSLADEMDDEGLPKEFSETIRSGWWTTCLEILPAKERRRGRY